MSPACNWDTSHHLREVGPDQATRQPAEGSPSRNPLRPLRPDASESIVAADRESGAPPLLLSRFWKMPTPILRYYPGPAKKPAGHRKTHCPKIERAHVGPPVPNRR